MLLLKKFEENKMQKGIKVYVLSEEVDVIGVYLNLKDAYAAAKKYDLCNWTVVQKTLN
jgi:hypothetical protein